MPSRRTFSSVMLMGLVALVTLSPGCSSSPERDSGVVTTVDDSVTRNLDQPAADPAIDENSSALQIDLQEGFDGSSVEVLIDGQTIYEAASAQTAALLGLADTFTVRVAADVIEIELRVNGESVGTAPVDLRSGRFIGLSVDGGALTVIQAVAAFGYG